LWFGRSIQPTVLGRAQRKERAMKPRTENGKEGEMDVIDVEKMEVFEAVRILGYLHVFVNIWLSRMVQRS
jgi:hypothetical protein